MFPPESPGRCGKGCVSLPMCNSRKPSKATSVLSSPVQLGAQCVGGGGERNLCAGMMDDISKAPDGC